MTEEEKYVRGLEAYAIKQWMKTFEKIAQEMGVSLAELADLDNVAEEEELFDKFLNDGKRWVATDKINRLVEQQEQDLYGIEPRTCKNLVCRENSTEEGMCGSKEDPIGCPYRMIEDPPVDFGRVIPSHAECVRILRRIGYLKPDSFGDFNGTHFMATKNASKLWIKFVELLLETGQIELPQDKVEELKKYDVPKDLIRFSLGEEVAKAKFFAPRLNDDLPYDELKAQRDLLLLKLEGSE